MARTTGKKQFKPATTTTTAAQATATTGPSSSIPDPFVLAPAQLRPLTSTLPTDHVYVINTDSYPIELKKRVFVVPVLLNLAITMLLAVRVYYAAPVYLDQMITIFGYETAWKVEPQNMGYSDILGTVANRTGLLMMDYAIFGFIGSWPWEFVFGSKYSRRTSPVDWRRSIGFRNTEIIVRKGRKWDVPLFSEENKTWTREDELLIKVKVDDGMRKDYIAKTGYLLLDKDWDLDFKGMIDAHRLVEKDRVDLKDINHIALIHYKNQWLLWRVHEHADAVVSRTSDDPVVRIFRERLTSHGLEDIFFRWIEIVQYETSLHGGFTPLKQHDNLEELRRLITARGVDYDQFLKEIGGRKGIPGISTTG